MANIIGAQTKYTHKTQKKILSRLESIFGPLASPKDISPFTVMPFYHIFHKSSRQTDWVCTNRNIRKTLSIYPFNNFTSQISDILLSDAPAASSMLLHIGYFWGKMNQNQVFFNFIQYFSNWIDPKSIQHHPRMQTDRSGMKNRWFMMWNACICSKCPLRICYPCMFGMIARVCDCRLVWDWYEMSVGIGWA